MKIRSFLTYFYFRVYELYKASSKSDGPVALIISLNISAVVNLLLYFYNLMIPMSGLEPLFLSMVVVDAALFLLTFISIEIYLARNRKPIGKQFEQFRKETTLERKRHGKQIWVYIGFSVLALTITYIIS